MGAAHGPPGETTRVGLFWRAGGGQLSRASKAWAGWRQAGHGAAEVVMDLQVLDTPTPLWKGWARASLTSVPSASEADLGASRDSTGRE